MEKDKLKILKNQARTMNSFITFEEITMDEDILTADEIRFTDVTVRIAHTGKNKNKSNFSKDMLEAMIPSLYRIPIVGYIEVGENNEEDFAGHEERYIIDKDGVKTEYLGRMYGFIPKDNNARFETIEVDGVSREYLIADGVLINKFSKMKEIIDRDVTKGHSMELLPETFDGYYDAINDQYMVTSADFEALCILGDSKIPAMSGGQIEKTQFTSIKFELQSLLQEMDLRYTSDKEAQKLNYENEKGGNVLDIKVLEAMMKQSKFTLISDEFVEGLKSKLESYETKEDLEKVLDVEQAVQFALTQGAQMDLLSNAVTDLEAMDCWYHDGRYYARDANFELNEVYVMDYTDWMDYGFTFTKDGDNFVIDEGSKFKIAWQPQKLEGGASATFTISEEAKTAFEFGSAKVNEAKEESKVKYEAELETQKVTFELQVSTLEEELSQLRTFKETEDTKAKSDFVTSVENLTDEEKTVFTESLDKYTLDELKLKIATDVGLKALKFTVTEIEDIKDNNLPNTDDDKNLEAKSYDSLME